MSHKYPFSGLCALASCWGIPFRPDPGIRILKPGANYVREQVMGMAPEKIDSIEKMDVDGLKASKSKDAEYYRSEATKLLKTVIEMYFNC